MKCPIKDTISYIIGYGLGVLFGFLMGWAWFT